jgi:phosphomannomutase
MGLEVVKLYWKANGHFPHNPEPLKEHNWYFRISEKKRSSSRYSSRSDVDRLAFICEDGEMFGEEYTLVACADYVLIKLQETQSQICLLHVLYVM